MSKHRHMIRGEMVYLRGFERADAELYSRWRSDSAPMFMAGFGFPGPVSQAAAEQLIDKAIEAQGKPDWRFLVCLLDTGRPIGEVFVMNVDQLNRSAEFGIFIGDPDDWAKGYGSDAGNAVCDFGFGRLDLARIELRTRADNQIGRASYRKAGFVEEGVKRSAIFTLGRRVDEVIMGLLREDWEQLPRKKSWELEG